MIIKSKKGENKSEESVKKYKLRVCLICSKSIINPTVIK